MICLGQGGLRFLSASSLQYYDIFIIAVEPQIRLIKFYDASYCNYYLLGKGGYVFCLRWLVCLSVCLFVYLFVCGQHYSKIMNGLG